MSNKNVTLLVESVSIGMDRQQKMIVENVVKHFSTLIEASVDPSQIKTIFAQVEKQSSESGKNRTVLGKSKDFVSLVNTTINNVGKWLQDTTPVKAFDQKFENLKRSVQQKFGDDSKVISGVKTLGDLAKKHPIKTAAIIGVMTVIASLASGPFGGAIAGQILRGTAELLKGEKLSTAIGRGMKTAAFGYLAANVIAELGDWLSGIRANIVYDENTAKVSFGARTEIRGPNYSWTKTISGVEVRVTKEDAEFINTLMDTLENGRPDEKVAAFDSLDVLATDIRTPEYIRHLRELGAQSINNDELYQFMQTASKGLQAASQGAAASSVNKKANESKDLKYKKLFYIVEQKTLVEGPMTDMIQQSAKSLASKIGTAGKNLTTKVTADKLYSAWQKAGSPTDVAELQNFLKNQGIDDTIIQDVSKVMAPPQKKTKRTTKQQPTQQNTTQGSQKPASQQRVEPTISRNQQQSQQSSQQQRVEPTIGGQQQSAQPAQKKPATRARVSPAAKDAAVFKNPQLLQQAWDKYIQDGGKVSFALKAVLKDMWMSAGGTVIENRK